MRILFLDQSGNLGGAELALLDLAEFYRDRCKVGLFQDGAFRDRLQQAQIPVEVLSDRPLNVRKNSRFLSATLGSLTALLPLVQRVVQLSRDYDIIYANTQKAFVVGALASAISRRPLVYHLHDILSHDHFSAVNLRIAVTLANRFAKLIIANSQASRDAFIQEGGDGDSEGSLRSNRCTVIYNGFDSKQYETTPQQRQTMRQSLSLNPSQFVIGHFSRLSPWKGQHVLIDAIQQCSENVVALLVGDALFGEDDYAQKLKAQVQRLGLQKRVHFLGFREDIPQLMTACDLVTHTSTAPEPFGRVIVEAMLCGTPVIAANAGGAAEIVEHDLTGWLCEPGDSDQLAQTIRAAHADPALCQHFAEAAQVQAQERFSLEKTNLQIQLLLEQVLG